MNRTSPYIGVMSLVCIVLLLCAAGCTTPRETAQQVVQAQVTQIKQEVKEQVNQSAQQIQAQVNQSAQQVASQVEQKTPAGKIQAMVGSQVAQVNASIVASGATGENNPTALGTSVPDLPFNQLYAISSPMIVAKADAVTLNLIASSTTVRVAYSPIALQLAGDDLGFTGQQYYDKISNMRADTTADEQTRIVYVKYLFIVWHAGYAIRDAASAESQGDYQTASDNTNLALNYLDGIKQLPNQAPKSSLNRLTAYLQNYGYDMANRASMESSLATSKIANRPDQRQGISLGIGRR
jgi:hypothetical protein